MCAGPKLSAAEHAIIIALHASKDMGDDGPFGHFSSDSRLAGETAAPRPPNERSRIQLGYVILSSSVISQGIAR